MKGSVLNLVGSSDEFLEVTWESRTNFLSNCRDHTGSAGDSDPWLERDPSYQVPFSNPRLVSIGVKSTVEMVNRSG